MSSNIIYTSIPQVLGSCSSLQQQLNLINTILVGMLNAISTATSTGQFTEYKLDTGQTKTEIRYSTLQSLQTAYEQMFRTKQMVLAQLNANRQGRVFQIVPAKNFTAWPNGFYY